jgi:pSer/pThr/pTyr-binding forkhead associated (FHA) protein
VRNADDAFCEVCGLDFATGQMPAAPAPRPAADATAPASGWTAVVETDRGFFDGNEAETPGAVSFPEGVGARRVTLTGDEVVVGRRSEGKGFFPEIDLSSPVSDPGVSHRHAVLRRAPDGGWTIVDEGSTNGTWINDDARPLDHGVATALHDGDHVNLGSFTRITIVHDDKAAP